MEEESKQPPIENQEASGEEVSTAEVAQILRAAKDEGVDFEEEDIELILGDLQPDEAIGYLFFALEQAGIEDPEAYLREKKILE